jgi:hypothetical protein
MSANRKKRKPNQEKEKKENNAELRSGWNNRNSNKHA